MGMYEVPLFMPLLGIGRETLLANFHMCGIMLMVRAVLNMLVRNESLRAPMYLWCLIFSLSKHCELLFCFMLLPLGHELWRV